MRGFELLKHPLSYILRNKVGATYDPLPLLGTFNVIYESEKGGRRGKRSFPYT